MDDRVIINGKTYSAGNMDYENPYFRTDSGLYSVVESIFQDTMRREGTVVKDYWTGEEYQCFFRRNKDTNQTNDNISVYYPIEIGIHPGSLITYYGKTYLVLNQESLENRVYHRSDGLNADEMLSTYNKDTGEEINLPCFAYDLTGETPDKTDTMSIIAGNCELMTGINEMSQKLKPNLEFTAMGNHYKIVAVSYKTGICRVTAQIIVALSDQPVYALKINAAETYTQGDAAKLTASATVNDGPIANPTLTWTSSDPSIVTMTEDGNALFAGVGTCAINCYWKEHNITETIYVEVISVPVQDEWKCEISGSDTINTGSSKEYTAKFYQADGTTEDTSIAPVWSLDVPSSIRKSVSISSQSGKTATIKVASGSALVGNSFGLLLTDSSGQYHATKTITIKSWL